MTVRQQAENEKRSNPCVVIGRVIALMVLAFAVCALVKTFVCGRVCEDCPLEMTTKKDAQFSLEDCSCVEMMAQMTSQSKDQQGVGDPCAEMMSQFASRQEMGDEFSEMMSQMFASCCGFQAETDKTTKMA